MDNRDQAWLWLEEVGCWVLRHPSSPDEIVTMTEVVRYGLVRGLRVECIMKLSGEEGGAVGATNPRWTLLREALERAPSTPPDEI